ncbi:hypothetical protein DRO21_07340 [archaeon]|nr:MAG: hypothetical protein DRO21_07340 [archaeon]
MSEGSMRETIKTTSGLTLEVAHKNGMFRITVSDDSDDINGFEISLYFDFENFEKLMKAMKEAWEDWETESNILDANEL